jgi:hypothetical protein
MQGMAWLAQDTAQGPTEPNQDAPSVLQSPLQAPLTNLCAAGVS